MDMSDAPFVPGSAPVRASGRGTRIPDLPRLLAVQAARQNAGPTAQRMRAGDAPLLEGDEPARLVLLFSTTTTAGARRAASGSFNAAVAAVLAEQA